MNLNARSEKTITVQHDVTCHWCGSTWRDSFPDSPGALVWCGQCDRTRRSRSAATKAHQLVTFAAHNQVAPLDLAQAARDEHEYLFRALCAIVQILDGSQPKDPAGALFVAQNAIKVATQEVSK